MNKLKCIVSCPADTYSGYGARSRDFVKALVENYPEWDIKILSQKWGNTRFGFLQDHKELDLHSRLIFKITERPEIWFQITIPNEFQPIGKFNVGVTAGIETTACDIEWIKGCNRMDLNLVSSNFSKKVLEETVYSGIDNSTNQKVEFKVHKPIRVLFEGVHTDKYYKKEGSFDLSSVKEDFCFLTMGHWMGGVVGEDRKNIGYTVKSFLETFKNSSNQPALILKTQVSNASIGDREEVVEKINKIRRTVKGSLPNIYLLHGELTDEDINNLYNHYKVKAMISLTKGEGFGRPLLEFTTTGKPVVCSGWSGPTDFLDYNLIPGELRKVHPGSVVDKIILKEASWFSPDPGSVGKFFRDVHRNYSKFLALGREQRTRTLNNFTYLDMKNLLKVHIEQFKPVFPEHVELKLPKLNLPKLKKIN